MNDIIKIQRYLLRMDGGPGSGNWGHSGRPGERGGSGKGGGIINRVTTRSGEYESLSKIWKYNNGEDNRWDPKLPKAANPCKSMRGIRMNEKSIRGKKMEYASCYDDDGKKVFANVTSHRADAVEFSPMLTYAMHGKNMTHNHPSGSTFSPEDINTLVNHDLHSIRAAGKNGTYQLMLKDPENPNRSKFSLDYESESDRIKADTDAKWAETSKKWMSGEISTYEANALVAVQLNSEFNYRRSEWLRKNAGKYGYAYGKDSE